ncbi:MAG TPA: NAD(P)/FAD-dependent oxidoreductase [Ilumatobacteraceae bacterium]|nr:NAD(P)/FAD-dependent oxidoreductase [Ilumatobacteraceae bacterium]
MTVSSLLERRRGAPGRRPHVVVVGAGFGGLAVARGLLDEPVDVTLLDANNFHTFQPLLYQVATAGLDSENVAYAIRGSVWGRRRRPSNVTVRMARVAAVDLDGRAVELVGGESIGYDVLVVATGAVSNDFGIPGVAEHTLPLKHLEDALALRVHVLSRFEEAAVDPSLVAAGALDVVICGGGPTGVEMAGGLRELYTMVLAKDFPQLPVAAARITLVEMADRLLTPFTERSSARALRTLTRRGVEVRLRTGVASVDKELVHLTDGTTIAAGTIVWATGVEAEGLAATLGTPTTRGGRLVVGPDLSIPGHPEVFAIGDIAASPDETGAPLPQVAQPAIQGGKHVARQIAEQLAGRDSAPFRYRDKGQMATIGRHDAVTELANGWRFSGPLGWIAWLGLHLLYLMGFRNRVKVFVDWTWNYLTYDRGSRILRESERLEVEAEHP